MEGYRVYKITNTINDKVYIGMTKDIATRWSGNGTQYKPPLKGDWHRPFWNAIQRYGWSSFDKKVLFSGLTRKEAIKKETETIAYYNSTDKKVGYNLSPGGNGGRVYLRHPKGMLGKRQSDYQIKNQREWASNPENNCMTNGQVVWGVTHKHPKGMKGKKHSEETKARFRKNKGALSSAAKKIKVVSANGETKIFDTLTECQKYYKISTVIYKMLKSGEPWQMPNANLRKDVKENLEKLVGYTFSYYSENTEVTDGLKS